LWQIGQEEVALERGWDLKSQALVLVFASLRNKKSIVFAFGKHLVRCQNHWWMIFFCEWECARNYSLDAERDL
jgi:hypothetical protein